MRLLLLDNFDSFTYTLVDYLTQAGGDCVVRRNNVPLDTLTADAYDAVVLSPGPGTPAGAGNLLAVVDHYHRRLPMLGVCLGQQAIGQYFGATLTRSPRPMHGKVSTIRLDQTDALFGGMPPQIRVTRYHSLALTNLPPTLHPIAETVAPEVAADSPAAEDHGVVMAIRHTRWPVWGVQFHPEAVLTEEGVPLLRNFIKTTQSISTQ